MYLDNMEIRKIKEELSLKYLEMTPEERVKAMQESKKRFEERMAKIREESKTA